MQELNNCIIDCINRWGRLELHAVKIGQIRRNSLGTDNSLRNLVLTSMNMFDQVPWFDLIDIQRAQRPELCKFTYECEAKGMKSKMDFFLMAKNLTKSVEKT